MNKKEIGELKLNERIVKSLNYVKKEDMIKDNVLIRPVLKRWFSSKFDILVLMIDFQGNAKFHLCKVVEGKIEINNGVYIVDSKNIVKTNTKFSLICYSEGNPESKCFKHSINKEISSEVIKNFLDSELVKMAIRTKNKEKGMTILNWLIIIGGVIVGIIALASVFGYVDMGALFMP